MKRLDNLDVIPAPEGEPIPTISGTIHRLPDGTTYYALDDIPLRAFGSVDQIIPYFELAIRAANENDGGPKARH